MADASASSRQVATPEPERSVAPLADEIVAATGPRRIVRRPPRASASAKAKVGAEESPVAVSRSSSASAPSTSAGQSSSARSAVASTSRARPSCTRANQPPPSVSR
ncbi:hypothetical protein [Arenivirga flava]|uniref:hypothetical protein n=1 Tax=Arenivirga flava TaxID=1930060 RepID=UPI0024E0F58C|nr:hypothetical protein [Arenivirga flava]